MIAQSAEAPFMMRRIRPLDLHHDLPALATLVEIAFDRELAATGSDIVHDMRQMSLWGPMLYLAGAVHPPLAGFVCVQDGRLVGNVSLNQDGDDPSAWVISNVAVLPEYRRRGIAKQLLDVAISHVRDHGGRAVFLQVRVDNEPAVALYKRRGFATFDTLHELSLSRHRWPVCAGAIADALHPVRAGDSRGLYQLMMRSKPREVLEQRPLKPRQFRRHLWWGIVQTLRDAFLARQSFEIVGEVAGEIVAYGSITARLFGAPSEMDIQVVPQQRGLWETELACGLLSLVELLPRQAVRSYTSSSHREALEALHKLGFETLRELEQMVLELGEGQRFSRRSPIQGE